MMKIGGGNALEQSSPCPVCKSLVTVSDGKKVGEYVVRLCANCELRFSQPMIAGTKEWYEASDTYQQEVEATAANRLDRLLLERTRWSFSQALGVVRVQNGSVLDIGCGTGEFLALVRESSQCNCTGIDFNQRELQAAREIHGLGDLFCGTLEEFVARKIGRAHV